MTRYSRIIGSGSYLPEKFLTNEDLAKLVDTSDEWIVTRTGIRRRHLSSENENSLTMAEVAARRAIEAAGIAAGEIQLIIVATCTPPRLFPSVATCLQSLLGISASEIPCFDINVVCSGFIYALSIADQYIKNGMVDRVLVVGADTLTKVVDWTDRTTCILFSDGAGAVVLQADQAPGIYSTHLHTNGSYGDLLYLAGNMYQSEPLRIKMQGNSVFKVAVTKLNEVVEEVLRHNQLDKDEIDWLIPHQANLRIIEATAKKLSMSMDKVILTVGDQGNTSAASVPLALDIGIRDGRVKRGDLLLLEAFGAGFCWGASLVRY